MVKKNSRIVQVGLLPSNEESALLVLVFHTEVLTNEGITIRVNEKQIATESLQPYDNKCIWVRL